MKNIFNFTLEDLEKYLIENGFKKYNATQIVDWIYKKRIFDFNKMSNISKNLISFLNDNFYIKLLELEESVLGKNTIKYLFKLEDNSLIECVLMKHGYGNSLCISSQVGCNMGCVFCESGKLKKIRNLSVAEMILQIISVEVIENIRIDSVVVMGIGEPFDNYDNLISFLNIVTNNKMINIGQRKVTVSTCGIVPKIKEFASIGKQVNLAISLHTPFDSVRSELMKINKAYSIREIMDALSFYIEKTNRRVTIEYIMLKNVNDREEDAKELSKLLKSMLVYVNLIPYNKTSNSAFYRSENFKIKKFYDILKKNGIEVTIRKEMGLGVDAACGQLRAKNEVN